MSRKLRLQNCPKEIVQLAIDLYVHEKRSSVMIIDYLKSKGFDVSYNSLLTKLRELGVIRSRSDVTKCVQFSEKRCCRHCNESFTITNSAQVYCRTCCPTKRAYQRLKYYRLSQSEFEHMLQDQQRKCKLCQTELIEGGVTNLNVDHSHVTGKVRGLLCHRCNMIVGFVDGTNLSTRLEALKNYIEREG